MRTIAILVFCLLSVGCYAGVTPPGVQFGTYGYGYGYAGDPCRQHPNRCAEHVTVPVTYRYEMTGVTMKGRQGSGNPASGNGHAGGASPDVDARLDRVETDIAKVKGATILLLEEEKREETEGK